MSEIYFTSDLHLGHRYASQCRGFNNTEDHDYEIISNISNQLGRKDKLFVLGDVAFRRDALQLLNWIPCPMEMLFGNHDQYGHEEYLKYFNKIHGFRAYKGFWLSHCPIHPQELCGAIGNIHGHVHKGAATPPIPMPYFNVNVDFHNLRAVPFDLIHEKFEEYKRVLQV